jgi:hypothetical protein
MWVGMSLSNAAAGTRPDAVTHSVVAIDCTVLLPLLFFGGLLLWRREAWDYVLAGFLLVKLATTGFTLAFTTVLGAWWAQRIDSPRYLWWARDPVPFAVCSSGITVARGAHDAVSKLDHPSGKK